MRSLRIDRRRKITRGAALLELAITLPIWALLLAAILFFSDAYAEKLKVHAAARYAAWHVASSRNGESEVNASALRTTHFAAQAQVRFDGEANGPAPCSQSWEERLAGVPSECSNGDFEDLPNPPSAGFISGLLSDVGLSFAIRSAHVELDLYFDFMSLGLVRLEETVWLHDNYVPGSASTSPDNLYGDMESLWW